MRKRFVRSIISKYPITSDRACLVTVADSERRNCRVHLRPFEAIAWIHLAKRDPNRVKVPSDARWYPAIIDSGCNEGLFLHEWDLNRWFGLSEREINAQSAVPITVFDKPVARIRLDCWIMAPPDNRLHAPTAVGYAERISLGQHSLIGSLRTGDMVRHSPQRQWWQRACERVQSWFASAQTRRELQHQRETDDFFTAMNGA